MNIISILGAILIEPIKIVYGLIFVLSNKLFYNVGISIIMLSLVVNFLVLPLYNRADAIQKEERDIENKLSKGVSHIKKAFSGDEKMMILQTYYRQNNYKPTDVFKGSLSILLEIPFFIAAYSYLSNEKSLINASFGPIQNLSKPDGLLVIGGLAINVLPIIMTLLNVVSALIYTKGFPMKTKIQTYGLAAFFLIFLYNSPSGLAFYWTLNNLFSLAKNVFYSLKDQKKVANIIWSLAALSFAGYAGCIFYKYRNDENGKFAEKYPLIILIGIILIIVYVIRIIMESIPKDKKFDSEHGKGLFIACSVFMTALAGLLIPSALIAASPQEYVFSFIDFSPLWYIVNCLCISGGIFLVWIPVFYSIASESGKFVIQKISAVVCIMSMINYLFFGTNLGVLSADMIFDNTPKFEVKELAINIIVLIAAAVIIILIAKKWKKVVAMGTAAAAAAVCCMSVVNIGESVKSLDKVKDNNTGSLSYTFTREGKNVVILFLDRAIGLYAPCIFKERPDLKEKFEGFTYYSNTLSMGAYTNFGLPSLAGGYEYTPYEMNKRDNEALVDKHNEALKMMPVLFDENGYNVTVSDPVYANYQWIPDTSIFNEYLDIKVFNAEGKFNSKSDPFTSINTRKRNFFFYGFMKISPLVLQNIIYDDGNYLNGQGSMSASRAAFFDCFNVLKALPDMTNVVSEDENYFTMIYNNATHDPIFIQEPDYIPEVDAHIDNTQYDEEHADRFVLEDGRVFNVNRNGLSMSHYQTNMAVYIKIAEWFDYLRENGVYDNTKIIIVSDHGRHLNILNQTITDPNGDSWQIELYMPLLMVKDFGSSGEIQYSDEFMTNADVPTLACEGVIDSPENPFTGKPINNDAKYNDELRVILSDKWSTISNSGNKFKPSGWAIVKDNVKDIENWSVLDTIE